MTRDIIVYYSNVESLWKTDVFRKDQKLARSYFQHYSLPWFPPKIRECLVNAFETVSIPADWHFVIRWDRHLQYLIFLNTKIHVKKKTIIYITIVKIHARLRFEAHYYGVTQQREDFRYKSLAYQLIGYWLSTWLEHWSSTIDIGCWMLKFDLSYNRCRCKTLSLEATCQVTCVVRTSFHFGQRVFTRFDSGTFEKVVSALLTSRWPLFGIAYPEETLRPRVVIVLRIHLLYQVALLGMLGCILLQQKQFAQMIHTLSNDPFAFVSYSRARYSVN